MALDPGTRIGSYEIAAQIGVGGMGEVYRATDLKLKRQVAIKVLPSTVTADADRLARFQREAEVLAALNHPNIAAIYGLEDFDQAKALVMELVDGSTLADRIGQGALPLDDALAIAKQIAAALEAAHEQGIVHRDLKPANIKVRPDGTVKVLDFGLAKALEPTVTLSPGLSQSPTITSPAMTGVGVLLGTAAYMSPEQARGRSTDKRSDIWAFGCLLYEMLTGRRAFDGDDVVETIGAVVHKEPDWSSPPAAIPATVRLVLRRCLEKDVKKRIRDIGDVVLALDGAFETHVPSPSGGVSRRWPFAIAAAVAVGLVALVVSVLWWRPQSNSRVVRMSVIAPEEGPIAPGVAITPDGSRIVFGNLQGLFVRALNQLEPVSIAAGRISEPFISPDGQWVGFWNDTRSLQKVAITGGAMLPVTQVASSGPRGSTWLPDDTIVFAANASGVGLQRVSAAGGTATVLTRPDRDRGEIAHVLPAALPGGNAVLFTIVDQTGGLDTARIAMYDLRSNTSKVLFRGGSHARYVSTGHLVYSTQGALRAVPFDLRRLEISGPSVPVEEVAVAPWAGGGFFDIANDGTLVYAQRGDRGGDRGGDRAVVWVDRHGQEESVPLPPRAYRQARLSPDGTRIVLFPGVADESLWMWDLRRPALIRLTSGSDTDQSPIWTPDGQHVVFASTRDGGVYNLWRQATNGAGSPERLTTGSVIQFPTGITPDGTHVVFHQTTATGRDVMRLALDRTRTIAPLVQTPDDERNGIVSADGRWLAYDSNSSGRFEVYVRPFPDTAAGFCLVSTSGGTRPVWSHQGKELFFVAPDGAFMVAMVETTGSTCRASTPTKVVEPGYVVSGGGNVIRAYDVSTDGQRLLMVKGPTAGSDSALPSVLVVVQNWTQELMRLAPKN